MNRAQRRKEKRLQEKNNNNQETLSETFEMTYSLHRPWADILFETQLPPTVLETMIRLSDNIMNDSNRTNWGNNLAGQIKEEPVFPPILLKEANLLDFFGNMVREYIHECNLNQAPKNQHKRLEDIKNSIRVTVNSMWIVEQKPGEYNPIHTHTNCDVSAVMYLKVPKFLDSEKPERADDGRIYFIGGSGFSQSIGPGKSALKTTSIKIKPSPGQFFIFPSHMMHTVYPYKTNDNFARRSVSFNATFEYET